MKKLLAVFLLLFVMSAQADEYVDDIVDGIRRVKMNVGWSTATDVKIDSIIRGYYQEGAMIVSIATDGKLFVDTVMTVAYNHMQAYDTLIQRVTDVQIFSKDSLHILKWMARDFWDTASAVNEVLVPEDAFPDRLPTHYDWSSGYLFMMPPPVKAGDSLLIVGYAKPTVIHALFWDGDVSFSDTTDCTETCDSVQYLTLTDVAVTYRPAVVYYATALFATRLELPSAQMWNAKFKEYIQVINATINRKEYNASTN